MPNAPPRVSLGDRLRDGDVSVVTEILATFAAELSRRLRHKYRSSLELDRAEQIVLTSIWRAWRHRASFNSSKGTLEKWLWRISEREAVTIARSGAFRQRGREESVATSELAALATSPGDDGGFGAVSACELSPLLHEAMKSLSEHERYILLADACSPEGSIPSVQLSHELRLTASTVRCYRARAKTKVKAELSRLGYPGRRGRHSVGGGGICRC
ncbi:MAG TPA: sigma-70 family RNA polymerase sigma factor [Pirellulales bacterium]|nr:sigma-70 family RNA polymerase sigma factor [Pirellulales bacterium]